MLLSIIVLSEQGIIKRYEMKIEYTFPCKMEQKLV